MKNTSCKEQLGLVATLQRACVRARLSRASVRNECPAGSGHSASPAAEQGLCCCRAVFTWAKQMVVSSYLCSYSPLVQKAPFFSWKRLANDYGGRCVTLMTSVALQATARQKLILKIQTVCLETMLRGGVSLRSSLIWSIKRCSSRNNKNILDTK